MLRCRCTLLCLICVLTWAADAWAQRNQLTAEIDASSPPVRSSAPIAVVWKLVPQTSSLLEGRFVLTLYDENDVVSRLVTDETVISGGEQTFRTVLPALDSQNPFMQLEIQLDFIGKREKINLGRHPLRVPGQWQRAFINCVCDPWGTSMSPERQQFVDRFRFETFNPDDQDRTITTFPAHIRPNNMPADPLGYCNYDLVLLMQEGLSELREKQLDVLLEWVDAGGSLCLIPGGVLAPHHAAFLNKLVKANAEHTPYILDSAGRLVSGGDGTGGVMLRRKGLGRVAVLEGTLTQILDGPATDVRRAAAFLWKMRRDQSTPFIERGKWGDVQIKTAEAQAAGMAAVGGPPAMPGMAGSDAALLQLRPRNLQLSTFPIQTGDQLLAKLMPQDIRVVPLNLIFLVLFLYVLLIGPADYYGLGALKLRRFTWVLFPAVTVGVAMLTVGLSNWYMSTTDNRRAVVFLDVGDGGKPVRANRFELVFTSGQRIVETEVKRALFSPLNHQVFGQGTWYAYQQALRSNRADGFELVKPAEYSGRLPTHFMVAQQMPQWTPQLNRLFSMAPGKGAVNLNWDALPVRDALDPALLASPVWRDALKQAIFKAFDHSAAVYLFTGTRVFHLAGPAALFSGQNYNQYVQPYAGATRDTSTPLPGAPPDVHAAAGFLSDVCVQSQAGLFSVISQLSPTGGRNFEDLTLLDPSDSSQALLVIAVEREGELLIYRKLYSAGDD